MTYITHALCWTLVLLQRLGSIMTESDLGTLAECLPSNMLVKINLTRNPDLVPEEMHLNDQSCQATEYNATQAVFNIPLYSCGTTINADDRDYLTYSNTVFWIETSGVISFKKDFASTVACKYSRNHTITAQGFQPVQELTEFDTGYGHLIFSMEIYTDSDRTERLASSDLPFPLQKMLYFKVEVHTGDDNPLVLHLEECWASNVNNSVHFTFIDQGCNNNNDGTLEYGCDNSSAQNFQLESFRLTDAAVDEVLFHCFVKVCLSGAAQSLCVDRCNNCASPPAKRKRRSGNEYDKGSQKYSLVVGPYLITEEKKGKNQKDQPLNQEDNKKKEGLSFDVVLVICIAVIVALCFICGTVVIGVVLHTRSSPTSKNQAGKDGEQYEPPARGMRAKMIKKEETRVILL